jgi:pimeloyl-ACP methyl ester carboxylesterase
MSGAVGALAQGSSMLKIESHYLAVEGRRVRYRRCGEGPPLVMMHGSPGDSAVLAEEMEAAGKQFTCIALDTPGFGGSDPLPGDVLTVKDLAQATAAAMAALNLPPARVFGTHTGAAIGAELGAGWPDQVSGLVLEGLPIFTEAEIEVLFDGYFAPMIPSRLGGQLIETWMRFRDQFTWFPWLSRDVRRLNPVDRPTPEEIDQWVSMFYRSCKTYGPAYKAACYFGHGAYIAAEALRVPTVFMASAEDMLFPHLDRLPPLRPNQRIERLPYDPAAKFQAIARFAASLPGSNAATSRPSPRLAGTDPAKGFVAAAHGQVFVRAYGDPAKPAAILLHGAPGTGLKLEAQARTLAEQAYVLVPDLPGVGESDAPSEDRSILDAAVDAVGAVADGLGLARFVLAATGCGCATAAGFAARGDPRLTAALLEDPPELDAATADAIAPEIDLSPEGGHWLKAWMMLRDDQIYRPWFDGRVGAQRKTQGNFDADWLHDQTVALMTSRATYHRLPRAAHAFDIAQALTHAKAPVRICTEGALTDLIQLTLTSHGNPS